METTEQQQDNANLEEMIARAVQTAMQQSKPEADAEHIDQTQQQQPVQQPQQQQQQPRDPMADIVAPYVQQANFAAAAANDKADFYADYTIVKDGEEDEEDHSISRSMRQEIEKTFTQLAQQGRPQTRESIYHYLLGKTIAKDKKSYLERSSKKKQAETREAQAGFDVGNANASQSLSVDQMWNQPLEKLQSSIADTTF